MLNHGHYTLKHLRFWTNSHPMPLNLITTYQWEKHSTALFGFANSRQCRWNLVGGLTARKIAYEYCWIIQTQVMTNKTKPVLERNHIQQYGKKVNIHEHPLRLDRVPDGQMWGFPLASFPSGNLETYIPKHQPLVPQIADSLSLDLSFQHVSTCLKFAMFHSFKFPKLCPTMNVQNIQKSNKTTTHVLQ